MSHESESDPPHPSWQGLAADIERTATAAGRRRLGRLSIEGLRLHERLLRAGGTVEQVLVAESRHRRPGERLAGLLASLAGQGTRVVPAPDAVLDRLTAGRDLGGLVGLVALPETVSVADVLCRAEAATLLVAVDVEDPGNVGALMRTALAAGAAGFVAVGKSEPFHPRAVRTSMGSLFRLPIVRHDRLAPLLEELSDHRVRTLAAVAEGGTPLPELGDVRGSVALLVGNESFGLSEQTASALDGRVTIPMGAPVDSFSVNAAAAILLYGLVTARR